MRRVGQVEIAETCIGQVVGSFRKFDRVCLGICVGQINRPTKAVEIAVRSVRQWAEDREKVPAFERFKTVACGPVASLVVEDDFAVKFDCSQNNALADRYAWYLSREQWLATLELLLGIVITGTNDCKHFLNTSGWCGHWSRLRSGSERE